MREVDRGTTQALVVGVYPSAFHVRWTLPSHIHQALPRGAERRTITALAVDVEPAVFWDGKDPDPAELLVKWKRDVGFDDGEHGSVRPGTNGPSGNSLVTGYLAPLGIDPGETAFTDVVPWYFVKRGSRQSDAMEGIATALAALGLPPERDLPDRPTTKRLVEIATTSPRRETLRNELLRADPEIVITVGQEALDAVRGVADAVEGVPGRLAAGIETASSFAYGRSGRLTVGDMTAKFLPLMHPAWWSRKKSAWYSVHQAWTKNLA